MNTKSRYLGAFFKVEYVFLRFHIFLKIAVFVAVRRCYLICAIHFFCLLYTSKNSQLLINYYKVIIKKVTQILLINASFSVARKEALL